jgi:hypothetical protein
MVKNTAQKENSNAGTNKVRLGAISLKKMIF